MIHLETDLYKEYLQFYTDQNFFSDRQAGWVRLSEWDSVYAFTGTIQNWGWRLQYERDAPLDRSGIIQAYADTLVTYRPADARSLSWWCSAFPDQNLTVYAATDGSFTTRVILPALTIAAAHYSAYRPCDLDLYRNRIVLFVDGNFFTDRSASNVLRPSEFDLVMGLAVRYHEMEIALIHERDLPLDRGGLVQRYVALQLRYESNGPDRRVLQANNSHSIARPLSALSPAARAMLRCPTCRMLKKSASGVLASFRASTYPKGTPRLFTRCGLAGRPFSASCGNVRLLCTRADYRISRVSI